MHSISRAASQFNIELSFAFSQQSHLTDHQILSKGAIVDFNSSNQDPAHKNIGAWLAGVILLVGVACWDKISRKLSIWWLNDALPVIKVTIYYSGLIVLLTFALWLIYLAISAAYKYSQEKYLEARSWITATDRALIELRDDQQAAYNRLRSIEEAYEAVLKEIEALKTLPRLGPEDLTSKEAVAQFKMDTQIQTQIQSV